MIEQGLRAVISARARRGAFTLRRASVDGDGLVAGGTAEWAIPWPCLLEFLAVVTHPGIVKTPTPLTLAFAQVKAGLESPSLVVLSENDGYFEAVRDTALGARVAGARGGLNAGCA